MENFALIALAENLRPAMEGLLIRRVVQHQPRGFILQTRSTKLPALKILMDGQYPAFYPSEAKIPVETPNSDFLMVLRKHFTSAELVEFRKPVSERLLEFVFKTTVPSKELETMSLVLELIPNAPNIILLDGDRRILSSWNPVTPQHTAGEFEPYAPPRHRDKISIEEILNGTKAAEIEESGKDPKWLVSNVAGLGPVFAAEILFRQRKTGRSIAAELDDLVRQSEAESHTARIYTEKPLGHLLDTNDLQGLSKAILSPVELFSLERTHSSREFGKITEAARFYFDELESRSLLEQAKRPLLRDLRTAAKRLEEREKRLTKDGAGYEDTEAVRRTAQMLTSSGKELDRRYEAVDVTDYFQESPKEVRIELNSALTLRENIEKLFKQHQKAERGKEIVAKQLNELRGRRAAIDERTRRLQAIRDWDTWLAVADSIAKASQGRSEPRTSSETVKRKSEVGAKHFKTIMVEGYEILLGRSGRDNDELTFRTAVPDDFWMHVAGYSGSHVVVRNPAKSAALPDNVLVKAAQLAAYFSQARNASKVEVHYTRRRHVLKMRGAKPGTVKLSEFKSVNVEPKNWLES